MLMQSTMRSLGSILLLATGSLLVQGESVQSQSAKIPETFEEIFAERDFRAVSATEYLRCLQVTTSAAGRGAFGKLPSQWSLICLEQGGEWRGVYGELGRGAVAVQLQFALRGKNGALTRKFVDTTRVRSTLLALRHGESAPLPGAGKYQFTPVAFARSDFVELWFLPVPVDSSRVIIGGDSLIQMSADGGRELGHGLKTPPIRELPLTRSKAMWKIESSEERIPTVSELAAAHRALALVPSVMVRTRQYESVLKRGERRWSHRRPPSR